MVDQIQYIHDLLKFEVELYKEEILRLDSQRIDAMAPCMPKTRHAIRLKKVAWRNKKKNKVGKCVTYAVLQHLIQMPKMRPAS